MSSASKAPVLPEQFGRYTNVRPLGQGGMGAVYRAHDSKLERDVVLKVCLLADNSVAKERFRREAKAAASLAPHQNLCPVYEFDVLDGIAYLTMAFVEGPTLHAWMTQRGGLNLREAALMVAKLAVAMQVAHDGGVVHRDLKPANIVINKRGEPVILDFGLARQLDEAGTRLTQLGAIYGTPAYMAPEQARGDTVTVGPAADIYALGVILYELLTGSVPFAGPPLVLMFNTVNTTPVPPSQRNPAVVPTLEVICLKALAKKAEDRQGSMKELARALVQAARAVSTASTMPAPRLPPSSTPTQREQIAAETMPPLPPIMPPLPPIVPPPLPQARETALHVPAPTVRKRREWKLGGEVQATLALVLVLLPLLGVAGWYIIHARRDRHPLQADKPFLAVKEDTSKRPDPPPVQPEPPKATSGDPMQLSDPVQPQALLPKPSDRPQPLLPNPFDRPVPLFPPVVPPQSVAVFLGEPAPQVSAIVPKHQSRVNSLGMEFVPLPMGTFYMGWDGEKKGKLTKIEKDFEIATTTVTQEQWAALMEGDDKYPSTLSRTGANSDAVKNVSDADLKRFPVENVSLDMVQKYIEKLNEKERNSGYLYRLPTEAEWEYSCRGGATSEKECSHHFYFAKPTDDLSSKQANFNGKYPFGAGAMGDFLARPTMVDDPAYPTNRLGLHHMHGNVWQWCSDLYEEGGSYRVLRGGSWYFTGYYCRAACRRASEPSYRFSDLGVPRLVRVPSRQASAIVPKLQPRIAPDINSLGMKFVHLPKGTFYMGWDGEKKGKLTEVEKDFEIAATTVTQGQWQAIMEDNPSDCSRDGAYKENVKDITDADLKRFPVEHVSFVRVEKFIEKLNEKERGSGWTYRLPTEKEWEYACRGGASTEEECSHLFYFDKPYDVESSKQAIFGGSPLSPKGDYINHATMVDDPKYPTNRLGLHHMHGNVWQWCSDLHEDGNSYRVIRGGSWANIGRECQAASRAGFAQTYQSYGLGFRLVRVPSAK